MFDDPDESYKTIISRTEKEPNSKTFKIIGCLLGAIAIGFLCLSTMTMKNSSENYNSTTNLSQIQEIPTQGSMLREKKLKNRETKFNFETNILCFGKSS